MACAPQLIGSCGTCEDEGDCEHELLCYTVTDVDTGDPIEGVVVSLYDTADFLQALTAPSNHLYAEETTDANGRACLCVPADTYIIRIRKHCWGTIYGNVTVDAGGNEKTAELYATCLGPCETPEIPVEILGYYDGASDPCAIFFDPQEELWFRMELWTEFFGSVAHWSKNSGCNAHSYRGCASVFDNGEDKQIWMEVNSAIGGGKMGTTVGAPCPEDISGANYDYVSGCTNVDECIAGDCDSAVDLSQPGSRTLANSVDGAPVMTLIW